MSIISTEIWAAVGKLFTAGLIYAVWRIAHDGTLSSKKPIWKNFMSAMIISIVLAFLGMSSLGTHEEGTCVGHPYVDDCETVEDFKPTVEQKWGSFLRTFILIFVPAAMGIYSGREEKNKITKGEYRDEKTTNF